VIQSLAHTIGAGEKTVAQLCFSRKKRNMGEYERAGLVSEREVREMIALARRLLKRVKEWLREEYPELL